MVNRVTEKVSSVSWFTRAGATTQEEYAEIHHPTTVSVPSQYLTPSEKTQSIEGDDWSGDDDELKSCDV